jgi:hypothetical protein
MLLAIAFFVGRGVGFVANRRRSWARKAKPESPENKAPEQSAPAVVAISSEPSDLTTRLQPLRAAIESFAESASHPRELHDRGVRESH